MRTDIRSYKKDIYSVKGEYGAVLHASIQMVDIFKSNSATALEEIITEEGDVLHSHANISYHMIISIHFEEDEHSLPKIVLQDKFNSNFESRTRYMMLSSIKNIAKKLKYFNFNNSTLNSIIAKEESVQFDTMAPQLPLSYAIFKDIDKVEFSEISAATNMLSIKGIKSLADTFRTRLWVIPSEDGHHGMYTLQFDDIPGSDGEPSWLSGAVFGIEEILTRALGELSDNLTNKFYIDAMVSIGDNDTALSDYNFVFVDCYDEELFNNSVVRNQWLQDLVTFMYKHYDMKDTGVSVYVPQIIESSDREEALVQLASINDRIKSVVDINEFAQDSIVLASSDGYAFSAYTYLTWSLLSMVD